MSVLAPGRAPVNDGELIRSFHERIRSLESATTARVGQFVLSAEGDTLVADAPNVEQIVFGATPDYTRQFESLISRSLASYVSAQDLTKALSGFSGVANSTPDAVLEQLRKWAQGLLALEPIVQALTGLSGGLTQLTNWALTVPTMINGVLSQTVTGWASALAMAGVPTPDQFVQLLRGLTPAAVINQIDGTLHATGVAGFVDNLNGTWQYLAGHAQGDVANLIQQADGTIISAGDAIRQQAAAALAAGAANLGVAAAAGQQMIDHGIAALQGEAAQIGQAAQDFGAYLAGSLSSWYTAISGTPAPVAVGAPQLTQAQLDAAARAAVQAQLTSAIQAQLPHFYGGHGTAGLSAQVTLSGTLPGDFTQILPGIAKYTTAFVTDSQEVSGIWSAVSGFGKYLVLRANADFSDRVYALIKSGTNACEIGCYSGGVKTWVNNFTLPGGNMQANAGYFFEGVSYDFTLTGPGGLSVTYTDTLHHSTMDALHRYGGFGTEGAALATQSWLAAGTPTFTVPGGFTTGDKFIIADLGSGAGGQYYDSATSPSTVRGGGSAAWTSAYLTYGTDVPLTTTAFSMSIPAGGVAALNGQNVAGNGLNIGGHGADTVVTIPGYGTVVSTKGNALLGPLSGLGAASGGAPSATTRTDLTVNGVIYTAANSVSGFGGHVGLAPGGGGCGGYHDVPSGLIDPASIGGPGGVYITPVTVNTALPDGLVSFTIFDAGPSVGPASAFVAAAETTASTSYTDLPNTNDQVTVTVGPSGIVLVIIGAALSGSSSNFGNSYSFAMSGANTAAAATGLLAGMEVARIINGTTGVGAIDRSWSIFPVFGLNPGATTFKMKYAAGGDTLTCSNRGIAGIPL